MRHYIFLDNFRGFNNTCIPIADINFLVGQNSTGKTSVLGLLKLLSGPSMFISRANPFAGEPVDFGSFADIVSAQSANRRYFTVGAIWEHPSRAKKSDKNITTAFLLTYVEAESIPRLSRFTFCSGSDKISIAFSKENDVYYRVEKCGLTTARDIVETLQSEWLPEHTAAISSRYSRLPLPKKARESSPPLLLLIQMAWEESRESRERNRRTAEGFDAITELFTPPVTWIAPIRTKPKRTYDESILDFSPEGEHTPYLIRKILQSKSDASKFKALIKRVGKESSLFQDVRIKNYGPTRFELDIVLDGKAFNIRNVGYGVSQSLPVMAEIIARPHASWFAIQQPEVHLHPTAQAALGDMLFEMAILDHKTFLVETHSDFTIDRFRMNYKKKRRWKPESQVLFFERHKKQNIVTPLAIGNTGELPSDQSDSYRQFFIREELRLLQL